MKKGLLLGIIIVSFIFVALAVFAGLRIFVIFQENECAKEGETSSNPSLGPSDPNKECCQGLIEISNALEYSPNSEDADENGCVITLGGGNICSNCGNNICESWEDPCSCPSDCQNETQN
jgi:hypothetical protein